MGTVSITHVRESNRTERPPGSPFQSKGLDETERPGGVQKESSVSIISQYIYETILSVKTPSLY